MMQKRRLGILISGSGSNMVSLVQAMQADDYPARPAIVISNKTNAGGLAKAQAMGVPTAVVDHREFQGDRAAFDAALERILLENGTELIAEAGFMRIHDAAFVNRWAGRVLNIHPSLLPLFPGLDTHARALEAGVAIHGCTVHELTAELDAGPILGQAAVPVVAGDTVASLAARVLVQEHQLYPAVLAAFIRDPDAIRSAPIALLSAKA